MMRKIIQKYFIYLAISIVGLLMMISAAFTFYNRVVMKEALAAQAKAALVKKELEHSYTSIRKMDVSLRGYAVISEDVFLFFKPEDSKRETEETFKRIEALLLEFGYSDPENYKKVKDGMTQYVTKYGEMAQVLKEGRRDEFLEFMRNDYGRHYWEDLARFSDKLNAHLNQVTNEAETRYKNATFQNILVQLFMIAIGLPTLVLIVLRLQKQNRTQKALLLNLDANNRKYLFDSGENKTENPKEILDNSIANLQKASTFVTKISEGDYDVKWDNFNDKNANLNKDNLVGKLILMREQMKKVKNEDKIRLWITEGLSEFSDIIRQNQDDRKTLAEKSVMYIVKYLKAQQGSLFALEENDDKKMLKLISCYAFNRKKHMERELEIGEGIVGQVFLEKVPTILTEVPQGYTFIRSGLGDATPSCLLIVPMKYNEEVKAVIEIAAFHKFLPHEVSFLEKAGEFMASALANSENAEKTQRLLSQFRIQTEEMRAQEEELRQNMEELEATQEEMRRKEKELEARLAQTNSH